MLPANICRTCAVHDDNLLAVTQCSEKYATKSYFDMLHELTQNDPLMEDVDDGLPGDMCTECLRKLEDAYAFVRQARQVHAKLLQKVRGQLETECLHETPIDMGLQQHIKVEADFGFECKQNPHEYQHTPVVSVSDLKLQPESDSDCSAKEDFKTRKAGKLRRSNRKPKSTADSETESTVVIQQKRRRGRPPRAAKKESEIENKRHTCDVCGKSFSWLRDLQRHARIHFEQASYVCETCGKGFVRKDKYMFHLKCHEKTQAKAIPLQLSKEKRFAERLYSSRPLKRIECKLCNFRCQRIGDLRDHLPVHVNVDTLEHLSADSDVVREHFGCPPQLNLDQIKQQICADVAKGGHHLDKFCAVVNGHGYELCLSDSDENCTDMTTPYQCLSCNMEFNRKHVLMHHTLEKHNQEVLQRCETCNVGFVCANLLKRHLQSQCQNQWKRHSCAHCPGRFIWQQNLVQHDCSERAEQLDRESRHFQCGLCDVLLQSMSALRAHLVKHSDDLEFNYGAAFFRCNYPRGVDSSQAEEVNARILMDFDGQDYGCYFDASTASGQELDFFDSDTDISDVDEQPLGPGLHSCNLCGVSTIRRAELMWHQQNHHSEAEASHTHLCSTCGQGFVAESLLEQHRQRVCAKRHAKFHCDQCNLHFIWESNYQRHLRVHHEMKTEKETEMEQVEENAPSIGLKSKRQISKLQCSQCDKVFIWPKDLTRHKRIHQPQALAQFPCGFCEKKFHRKDGLKSHMRVHCSIDQQQQQLEEDTVPEQQIHIPLILSQLCRPNGCKRIQCMICLSQHTKISDLRTHLSGHEFSVELSAERVVSLGRVLYPEQDPGAGNGDLDLEMRQLMERIQNDVGKGVELDRFISITNESGMELSLDSSETDSDSDSETMSNSSAMGRTGQGRVYSCDLCEIHLSRKYLLYAHQLEQHNWEEATLVCSLCQARFVSAQLLDHHYRTLCRNSQKRFLCRKCPLRFRWRENLKLHIDVAHQETNGEATTAGMSIQLALNGNPILPVASYNCNECNRSFKMQKDLTRHTLMHANESSIFRCRWCARRFYRQSNLLQHIERHGIVASQLPYAESLLNASRHPNGRKSIECKVCETSFLRMADLRQHLTAAPVGSHHDINSMLNYSITNQLGYELHLNDSETDEESKSADTPSHYTCGMCQLRCIRKYELHQHQQAMHRLERITTGCDQCIYKSVCLDLIAYHKRTQCGNSEKRFKCDNCGYRFMWESNLLRHNQLQHQTNSLVDMSSIAPQEVAIAECQIFHCGQCPRKYNRKDRLAAHVKKCHGPGAGSAAAAAPSTKKNSSSIAAKQQKSFLCAFCGKAVSSSSNLIIHIRRHTGEKPFKCDYCEMAFPRSSDLQCHRRTHTGERPHICTVCQKAFARSYKLQQHMRIHNGERPYKCTYCDKSFTQSNDLTLHIRRHTGERPYQCETCGERFIQGTALKNHRNQSGHFEATAGQLQDTPN